MAKPATPDFLGGTPLTQEVAPPPEGAWEKAEAENPRPEMVAPPEDEDDASFEVPDLPQRAARRRKIDMYVPTKQAARVDAICRYAKFNFDVNKGETQELILKYGLNNEAEVMRALRAMVEDQ